MENASKALIIAGTALIIILVISGGMYLFRNAGKLNGAAHSKWTTEEITNFNNQFDKFKDKQSGSRVKELIAEVNRSNERSGVRVEINSSLVTKSDDGVYYPTSQIQNRTYYNITFDYENGGRITRANISM